MIIWSKTVAVKTFLKHWVSLFGIPRQYFSDNGGEFIGDELYDMCKAFNIKLIQLHHIHLGVTDFASVIIKH